MLLQSQAPEMVRVPLEELVLQIHLLKLGKSHDFLQCVLEPPPLKSVQGALSQLQSVGALSKEEQLTPLGMPCSVLNLATLWVSASEALPASYRGIHGCETFPDSREGKTQMSQIFDSTNRPT